MLQAVVNQTISGLACGKPIRGTVAFLGGPLHFLPETRKLFVKALGLQPEHVRAPDRAELFVAMGAALASCQEGAISLAELRERARGLCHVKEPEVERMRPLFRTSEELASFRERHGRARIRKADIRSVRGPVFLGVDAGSTTTKAVLTDRAGAIAWSCYRGNGGDPLGAATSMITEVLRALPDQAWISRACATGYGEALVREAFRLDDGEVETVAHYTAASELPAGRGGHPGHRRTGHEVPPHPRRGDFLGAPERGLLLRLRLFPGDLRAIAGACPSRGLPRRR